MSVYNRTSPYYSTSIVNGYLDILNFKDIPANADDVEYTVTSFYTHRPDLLANDLYNDPQLWWVFAVRNKDVIKDSIFDLVPGQTIFLPTLQTIKEVLG